MGDTVTQGVLRVTVLEKGVHDVIHSDTRVLRMTVLEKGVQ